MNVLEILQSAARQIGIEAPATYNTDTQLLEFLYQTARELRNSRAFTQQKRTATITLVGGTYEYALPTDFYAGLLGTYYDQSQNWSLVGPLSDSSWNYRIYGPGGVSSSNAYRVFGPSLQQYSSAKMLKFDPNSLVAGDISFDYITSSLFYPTGWTPTTTVKETVTATTDIPMFDDDIMIIGTIYKYHLGKGNEYEEYQRQFNNLIEAAQTRWTRGRRGSFSRHGRRNPRYMPEGGSGGWSF